MRIHGDSDARVSFEAGGSVGEMVEGAKVVVVEQAPHGLTVTHGEEFDAAPAAS